ncbi:MAG: DUF6152 family protein [Gammaproteobacteria bacterium]
MIAIRCLTRRLAATVVVTLGLAVLTSTTFAHHSFAPALTDDGQELIEVIDGTIELYRLLNPHTAIIVNAVNENGEPEDWLVELSSLASLVREGWTDDSLSAGDKVTVAVLRSHAEFRGRLRAVLVQPSDDQVGRLLVAYGIRGDTPVMRRLQERLPLCGDIDARLGRSQCFMVDSDALQGLQAEFPGHMAYVLP